MDSQRPQSQSPQNPSILLKLVYWHRLFESDTPPRLGIDVERRIPYAFLSAFSTGMALGYFHGSKKAGLVFRAENAHRFPTTSAGWFQYHKTKNYISVVGGAKDGLKMGMKLGAGALAFCLFEETVDYARHDERDFLSTVTAGLSCSGIYSLLARTAKLGLKMSLAYGLLQDALETAKGNRPSYVDFILGNRRSRDDTRGSV
ncbi:hypothetical protein POX_b02672 [Penicillium oxalicum]|uniref:hypothetical protein n=1 Tax=Penicillium oxalicum TaxID=69781 RepID=UPI0020B6B9EF|nr:hypothetical protein POX_b02672 [Penicillium oxalicum]KAI2792632.1 hypothetical protein POX_b02672 [Penicillium oxalicum]